MKSLRECWDSMGMLAWASLLALVAAGPHRGALAPVVGVGALQPVARWIAIGEPEKRTPAPRTLPR